MDRVKKHFQDEACNFDERIVRSVPFYMDMLEALVSSIPFDRNTGIKVVDLGCGTGTVSVKTKEFFPKAEVTCVDFADNMLNIARDKLKDYDDMKYIMCDYTDFDFTGYDVVLSSLALHHIRDKRKKLSLYGRIFKGLNGNGIFYNADLVLGSGKYLQDLNLEKWREFLLCSISETEVVELKKKYEEEDHPFRITDEIAWFREAGFSDIDIVWKYYHFAVYGGRKEK